MQLINETLNRLPRESSLSLRLKRLKEEKKIFQKKYQKPDCVFDQYLPLIEGEAVESKDYHLESILFYVSKYKTQILYESNFAISRFIIFVLGMLEILLNITFNQGMLNLLIRFSNLMQRK